ncbi:HAMP domain-containing protein [Streptomyces sp. SID4919]|uniref:sensor histidine kinase n=1 Tax=unclassified Streptomyces TaxID=2593676 RepID=UPI000823ED36|nr:MULTISPECIES: HAMP domain-containing sensor histidine kinase [unclassified Streptomyces]MYY10495.1 HAMP domain-containing protein [Streptomyces sp. SID4919]SCK46922.1 Signal transduction histidine kinase [Streptomyces sp. AmelKG-E11A]
MTGARHPFAGGPGLWSWRSLRWKIAALVIAASCGVALAVGGLVHQATANRFQKEGEGLALEELRISVAQYRANGRVPPSGTELDPTEMPPELVHRVKSVGGAALWYDEQSRDGPWMWAARPVGGGEILAVAMHMGTEERELAALDRTIIKVSGTTLLVIVPLSVLLTELLSRRLRHVARTARRIADGELDARTGKGGHDGDEITGIAAAVDSMAQSLQQRLLDEQRFTADVAHELRTPLMGLVTSTELLPDSPATELVRDRVRVLRALVEDLLEISRLDAGAEASDARFVPVGSVVEASVTRTGEPALTTVVDNRQVSTDPRRLDRIIANLVLNAHRHGGGRVEVRVDGPTVVVRDHGPGFPAALLADGPQRFRTGASERGHGHGLGLTIAAGQARVIGASLELANAPDGGAVAVLRLPDGDRPPD